MVRLLALLVSIVAISISCLYGQAGDNPAQAQVDSLRNLLKNLSDGRGKGQLYKQLCFTYASTLGNVAIARLYADSVRLLAEQLNDESGQAASDYCYGMIARYDGRYSDALNYLGKYINYSKAIGDSSQVAAGLHQMAVAHEYLGNYERCLSLNYRIIEIHMGNGYPYGVGITLMSVGNLFVLMKKYEDAIAMYSKAFSALDSLKPDLDIRMSKLRLLMNLGNTYLEMKHYDKSRRFYEQSLFISDSLGSKRTMGTSLSSLGEILYAMGKYDSALIYHLRALSLREQTFQKDKILLSLIRIGETYLFLKEYPLAERYLLRALSFSKELHAKPTTRDTYERLSVLYASQKNYQKAYAYHQLFSIMKDSVMNEETAQQLGELQTKYETGEKDKQIELLAKEKEVQRKELQRQAALKKASIGGMILVSLLAGLLVYLFYQRLKNQKILAVKNAEVKEATFNQQASELEMKALRAQINPHFLFNCMNSINRMILNGEGEAASLYLAKFSKLIRLILENAESATVSLQSELTMLESYIQLEELRFKGKIGYTISVDETIETENTYLPSMVLQPFVENAIWHGLMHKETGDRGTIEIEVREMNDRLLCTIQDNGIGREKALALREKSVLKSKSMGMKITEERLRLLSQDRWDQLVRIIDLKDSLNQAAGTRVEVNIPIS